jgi:hemolysin III
MADEFDETDGHRDDEGRGDPARNRGRRSGRDRFDGAREAGRERIAAARENAGERAELARVRATAAREAGRMRVVGAREAGRERIDAAKVATGQRVEAARVATGERVEAAKAAAGDLQARVKPKLRGVIHGYAFPVSLMAGLLLVLLAGDGAGDRIPLGIYALSLSALLGTSALYHRVDWRRPRSRLWMRRLDHSMIFLLIAGTVTPFAVLVLDGPLATAVLIAIWGGAAAGVIVEMIWIDAPKWVSATVYITVGALGGVALPAIVAEAGLGAGILIALGGLLYIAGAVVYARQRPDPKPTVFGYHEIFHVLVVAAAAAHFVAVAVYAGPGG